MVPYVGITYLYSTLKSYPSPKGLFRYPHPYEHIVGDFLSRNSRNIKNWGFVVGAAIISNNMIMINAEGRFYDQNAINVSGEIRF